MNDSLKSIVAELLAVTPDQVLPDRALSGARLQGSLGRSILDAAMRRRLGIQSPACYTAKTFGELESAVNGSASYAPASAVGQSTPTSAPAIEAPPSRVSVGSRPTGCGVDIELIDNLPASSDFWSHEFYTANFTPAEIAYCLTQQSPPQHFAARWCAKEALKKCEPGLMNEPMKNLEIVSRSHGTPTLVHHADGIPSTLPHAVSLSHTNQSAIAVVVRAPTQSPMTSPVVPPIVATGVSAPQSRHSSGGRLITLACAVLALIVATAALFVAIRHR